MSFQDKDGKTALHDAGAKGQNDALKILLSASGVDVSLRDNMGATCLRLAAKNGHNEVPDAQGGRICRFLSSEAIS